MSVCVGVDLVEISRIRKAIDNPAFLRRCFSPSENQLFAAKGNRAETVAANFAAKEAFSKAIGAGVRGFSLNEVEILRDERGKPYINLLGRAKAASAGFFAFSVSLTHTKDYAQAVVVAERAEIMNLESAKEYFFSMGCSHFHMSRENSEKYEMYCALQISKEKENEWRLDHFQAMYNEVMSGRCEIIWICHSSMAELAIMINTDEAYETMITISEYALQNEMNGNKVIVAETINGRQHHECRSGLIFHSFDIGRKDLAKDFANLSLALTNSNRKLHVYSRVKNAIKDCKQIMKELHI